MEGPARHWIEQQHRQRQPWDDAVDTSREQARQHGACPTIQGGDNANATKIKHGKTHSELVQYYTSLHHALLEKSKEAKAAAATSLQKMQQTNNDEDNPKLQVDIMMEMEEMER